MIYTAIGVDLFMAALTALSGPDMQALAALSFPCMATVTTASCGLAGWLLRHR